MTTLPVASLNEALPELRRPFTPEAIQFRPAPGKLVLAYVNARVVIERLNAVVGGAWSSRFEPFPGGKQLICHLTLFDTTRSDVGSQATGDRVDPVKAGYSDGIKRAAVHYGVAVSVYALKQVYISDMPAGSTKEVGQKKNLVLTEKGEKWLRDGYRRWLRSDAGKHFGEVLDHGDVEGAVGDPEAAPSAAGGEPVTQPSLELEAAITKIRELWDERADKRKISRAKLNAQINSISTVDEAVAYAKTIPLKETA